MTIQYKIRRLDLAKAYFYNLLHSAGTQRLALGVIAFYVGICLVMGFISRSGKLVISDGLPGLVAAIICISIIPVASVILAKTDLRTLTVNPEGIETQIGSRTGKIPWRKVESIRLVMEMVLITGKTANTFVIPLDTFSGEEQQNSFVRLATEYHSVANVRS